MNNKKFLYFALLCFAWPVHAREIRTPYTLYRRHLHHPVISHDLDETDRWYFEPWAGYHHKRANTALGRDGHTTPISTILFNSCSFSALDLLSERTQNTLDLVTKEQLSKSIVSLPNISYREHGGHFGFIMDKGINKKTRFGLRATVPVKKIEVNNCDIPDVQNIMVIINPEQAVACPSTSAKIIGDHIGALTQLQAVQDILDVNNVQLNEVCVQNGSSFAYRLDFLSLLPVNPNINLVDPLVRYGTAGNSPTNDTYISSENITNQVDSPSVNVVARSDGSIPPQPFGAPNTTNFTPLPGDGAGLDNNERAAFQPASSGTGYTPLENTPETQRTLWIVPTLDTDLVQTANNPLQNFSFQSARTIGVGDLDLEFYLNHHLHPTIWIEGRFGIRIPTGDSICCEIDPCTDKQILLKLPAGNNDHTEVHIGGALAWSPRHWAHIYADIMYSGIIKKSEFVAAAFDRMCIKNIGPCRCTNVSWGYFLGHISSTMHLPRHMNFGAHLSYELYAKRKDKIGFAFDAPDLVGNRVPLDPHPLEDHTTVRAHKLQAELFYIVKNQLNIFVGASYVVAGKNVLKETDVHVGFGVSY